MTASTGARYLGVPEDLEVGDGTLEVCAASWYGYQAVIFELLYGAARRLAREEFVEAGTVVLAPPEPLPPILETTRSGTWYEE